MSRNAAGAYNLPIAPFVAGQAIVAADMNSNLNDIATALTLTINTAGTSELTAPVKAMTGSATEPSYTFNGVLGSGFYTISSLEGFADEYDLILTVASAVFAAGSVGFGILYDEPDPFIEYHGDFRVLGAFYADTLEIDGGQVISASVTFNTGGLIIPDGNVYLNSYTSPSTNPDKVYIVGNFYISYVTASDARQIVFDGSASAGPYTYVQFIPANVEFEWIVDDTPLFSMGSDNIYFEGQGGIYMEEKTTPSTPAGGVLTLYPKDSGGASCLFYVNDLGEEIPLGKSGIIEEVLSTTIVTSVSSIVITLSKVYKRIFVHGVSISGTASTTREFIVEMSDDGGGSWEAVTGGTFGGPPGSISYSQQSALTITRNQSVQASDANWNFNVEVYNANQLAAAKPYYAQCGSSTDNETYINQGQIAQCDEIDAIRIRNSDGTLLDSATITVYGEIP